MKKGESFELRPFSGCQDDLANGACSIFPVLLYQLRLLIGVGVLPPALSLSCPVLLLFQFVGS